MASNNSINSGGVPIPLTKGGTGANYASATALFDGISGMTTLGDILYGGASGTRTRLAGNTTTVKLFLKQTGDGANSAAPAWGLVTPQDAISGQSITTATVATDDKVLIQDTSASDAVKTVTAQSIADLFAGSSVTEVTGTSQTIAVNGKYISNNAGMVTFTVPTTAAVGTTFEIAGKGAGLFTIVWTTGQSIQFGNVAGTTTTGTIVSEHRYDYIKCEVLVADLGWSVVGSQGNFTIT